MCGTARKRKKGIPVYIVLCARRGNTEGKGGKLGNWGGRDSRCAAARQQTAAGEQVSPKKSDLPPLGQKEEKKLIKKRKLETTANSTTEHTTDGQKEHKHLLLITLNYHIRTLQRQTAETMRCAGVSGTFNLMAPRGAKQYI